MKCLYGKYYEDRYRTVVDFIPESSQVLDLCCGDCYIYQKYLKDSNVQYLGIDNCAGFEKAAARGNIPFRNLNIENENIPPSDYLIMMGSFYQFYHRKEELLVRCLKSARKRLIITEPVVNLAQSPNGLISKLAKFFTSSAHRFTQEDFLSLVTRHQAAIEEVRSIANGREILAVFNPRKVF